MNRFEELLAEVKDRTMTDSEKEEQRRSFAFGNTNIENSRITKEMVAEQAENLTQQASK
jgi:cytidylate kinase